MSGPEILVRGEAWTPGTRALVADGAWGSELFSLGLGSGETAEEWNLSHPDQVASVAQSYLRAGSSIVETNSFGGNRLQLARHDMADQACEINRLAAEITAGVLGPEGITAGSIGPTGAMLMMGDVSESEAYEAFAEQARGLAEGGAQWIAVETMTDFREMAAAVRAAARETSLVVSASMTYEPAPDGFRTMMGHAPEECVRTAEDAGASIIGANCGKGIDYYPELTRVLRRLTALPLWIYPNAGVPLLSGGVVTYPLGPEEFATACVDIIQAGADIIGGCCGTTPAHIAALAQRVGSAD